MSKKLRFYTKEEMQLLEQFAKSGQPVGKKLIGDFCKVNKRSETSVGLKVYELRRKLGIPTTNKKIVKTVNPKANFVKDKTVATMSKGEFKIPINSWNVSNENGQFYFIVKF